MSVAGINGIANHPVYTPGKATGNVSNNNFSQQINQAKAGNIHTLHWFDTLEGDTPLGALGDQGNSSIIEASSKVEGKKSISLRSYMKGNLFFIEVENDFSSEIFFDSETGLPISSKADKQFHGLGMENIQRCAKKYMGGIDITIQDVADRKKFNLTIMMYEKYFAP